jgi:alkaline phosphatase D
LLGVFLDKLEALPVADQINLIVTSDHGMGPTSPERCIKMKEYIDFQWFEQVEGYSPNLTLKVKAEFADTAWKALSEIPNSTTWKHGEVPDSLHYGNNPRTLDFIFVADSAWQFTLTDKISNSAGAHGYNPYNKDMHAIFYAKGPAFKPAYLHPAFENIHLYPLVCELLGIPPAPVDGHIDYVKGMLKD